MKITKHISFHFLPERIIYINNIIDETNKYEYTTDIFIHTNFIDLQKYYYCVPSRTQGSYEYQYGDHAQALNISNLKK